MPIVSGIGVKPLKQMRTARYWHSLRTTEKADDSDPNQNIGLNAVVFESTLAKKLLKL